MNTQVATHEPRSIITTMAERFGMERKAFESTMRNTIMPARTEVSNEQLAAFAIVAQKYSLNPFTKEIYAFPAKGGGIQPIVSIDGWLKIINDHPKFDGMEFEDHFADAGEMVSITCRMYRSDRSHPTVVTEYMAECLRKTEPWAKWPARMLRHKATIQAARYAFGFSGIMDPDEADRMELATSTQAKATVTQMPRAKSETKPAPEGETIDAEIIDPEPKEPGIHGISESMERLLIEAARNAGLEREHLLQRWPCIDASNFNQVRAELKAMTEAA